MIVPPRPAADLEDRVLPSKTGSATTARTCRPLVCLHLITSNADRQAQHIAANYRQLADVLLPTAARRRSQATLCRALPRRRGWPDMTAARRAGSRVSRSDQGGCELRSVRADLGRGRRAYASARPAGPVWQFKYAHVQEAEPPVQCRATFRCWPRCRSVPWPNRLSRASAA